MDAKQLFDNGKLSEALETINKALRISPSDSSQRYFLAELLCFVEDWDRADKQLDIIGHQNPEFMPGLVLLRQLLRAGQARHQFFGEGRAPEFLVEPTEQTKNCLKASILLRDDEGQQAASMLSDTEQSRPQIGGTFNGTPFSDFRDLDDLTASNFELLAANGKYYWVPFDCVQEVEFEAPKRPLDLFWRRCGLATWTEGPLGNFFMPAIYPAIGNSVSEEARMGRISDWNGDGVNAPVRGIGQRMFLVDESTISLMEIKKLGFNDLSKTGG